MKTTAYGAWKKSLTLALLPPTILWPVILWANAKQFPRLQDLLSLLSLLALAAGIHFLAYALTGLPMFLRWFRNPRSLIWYLPAAVATGMVTATLIFVALDLLNLSYIGAAYGFITAFAAWRQRPRHHENAHHLP